MKGGQPSPKVNTTWSQPRKDVGESVLGRGNSRYKEVALGNPRNDFGFHSKCSGFILS